MNQPFAAAIPIIEEIEAAGFAAYFVGGAVRDYLLNKPIHDVDIATSATPEEVKSIFKATVDIGIEHGTVMVLYNNETYEVTTFRTESEYEDFRRPKDVAFVRNLRDDLQRRDFTMNSLAMDKQGHIIDYFDGKTDLANKRIVTVGSANERFAEDALRMMRAVRFVSTLGFQLEEQTRLSVEVNRQLLEKIAVERITAEFEKLLLGEARNEALKLMMETKLYEHLPMLKSYKDGLSLLSALSVWDLDINEMWSLLLITCEISHQEADRFLRKWKLPVKRIKTVQAIIKSVIERQENHQWTSMNLYIFGLNIAVSGEKVFSVLTGKTEDVIGVQDAYSKLSIKSREELQIGGRDLMEWSGKPPGPWMKDTIANVETAVVENRLANDSKAIKEWLKQWEMI
ncbi:MULTISPECIES: CCA tRNA nucleotidyltransferase [Bacillaceae]|uniref:CCA tRNA nucleotidyltransferase n=1 Tax=Bacillaceae TaxID=186817 RepID=UPI001E5C7526|nr:MULTISPECIES: CCA tRNA nucleotidyltransferase [Bacillaceae]MCE4047235.1 CCA tRNA nucleotidyltransferase [Bacillus sp. Au-Bac7]MDL0435772.1 CCA tRNA nucleotidyltransferase [Niallia sp. SS-2023]UPO86399.1 CCA tRNA nucleotidyltransferase [Niallia sp. Man26]